MTNPGLNMHPLEAILTWCREADPSPWYPSTVTQVSGIPREQLDPYLDELRLGGLIRLTDWVAGKGQGYALTPAGIEVAANPRLLERIKAQGVPPEPVVLRPTGSAEADTAVWDRGEQIRNALLNPRPPVATLALIFANIVVFLYGYYVAVRDQVPANEYVGGANTRGALGVLHEIGAVSRLDVFPRLEWWRLFTACFVHIGLLHLGVNMFSLYIIGPLLERMWGSGRFLVLYLIAGLGGSAAVVIFEPAHGVTAGASGAIWGILASMIAWVLLNRSALPQQIASRWLRQLGFIFILNIIITHSFKEISKAAHYGGGVAGLVAALPLNYLTFGRGRARVLAALGVAAVPLAFTAAMVISFSVNRDWEKYDITNTYRQPLQNADELLVKLYNESFNNLLDEDRLSRQENPERVQAALRKIGTARTELSSLADSLSQARNYQDANVAAALASLRAYVETWFKFLDLFEQSLKDKNWTADDEHKLQDQRKRVWELQKQLGNDWQNVR
jgi:membrane associated rhomboid family serine protease